MIGDPTKTKKLGKIEMLIITLILEIAIREEIKIKKCEF